ncbi:MAG TPA: YbaK/EbsC family protein [Longimicrobiales bacterium]|nr:YbaK/EbsC family protein [Longimicrobiales bacterium]
MQPSTTGVAAVTDYLDGQGLIFELVEHEPTITAAAEAAVTHTLEAQVAKTVVLHDGSRFVIAAVPADRHVDLKKLRALLGAGRGLRLASEDEMDREFPSFEVGALPPFGPLLAAAEVIDERLLGEARILCAAGDHRHSVLVDPRAIGALMDAVTGDVCED